MNKIIALSVVSGITLLLWGSVQAASVKLSWEQGGDTVPETYIIERRRGTTGEFAYVAATEDGTIKGYTDTRLANATLYEWRIKARYPSGVSLPSDVFIFTTPRVPPPLKMPVNVRGSNP